jgi:diguanylate cyclase (GGDEF)-like protein
MYKYFLVLADLNLPDAPNGEIVDYALKLENKIIVLSGSVDKELRKQLLKKNIIDYINKGGINDINYIINIIKRLEKNKKHTILVVDDSMVFRKQMKQMLENLFYKVVTVAHGEEALNLINTNMQISLVLTDYNMPVMDGLELTAAIREKHTKNDLSIIAISSNNEEEINALFLKEGANDYINKPYSKEEFSCRVNNSIEALENIQIITNSANRDYLTGLYNRRYFFRNVQDYFTQAVTDDEDFAILMIDIDHFKNINDTYGHDTGDKVIVNLSDILRTNTHQYDVVTRFGGDEFCIILKGVTPREAEDISEKLRVKTENSIMTFDKAQDINITISIGLTTHHEGTLEDSVNEADDLLYQAKKNGRNQVVSN